MIGIYAEGSETIGIGHVMRCLTIADALRSHGKKITFYANTCHELIEGRGYKPETVPDGFEGTKEEFAFWEKNAKEKGLTLLLLDSYKVTPAYLERLGEVFKTAYLDDMCMFPYPVDMVINYNIFADKKDYKELHEQTDLCLGTSYAPVRAEFVQNRGNSASGDVPEIFISVGGSDSLGLSPLITKVIKKNLAASHLHVLCGPYSNQKEALTELQQQFGNITIYEKVTDVWNVMRKCNMAVSAAGTTMYELAAMGVPVLTFSFVENQRRIAEGFALKGAAIGLGMYEEARPEIFEKNLAKQVQILANDRALREQIKKCALLCVDGMGAMRIAEALAKLDA